MEKKFSQWTIEKIKSYVYLLQDPRDNKIFYIWKWQWNRIFNHIKWAIFWEKDSDKIKIILDILNENLEPIHKIIRYWLTEKEAFEVESSLIDFYWINNLSNIVKWHNSNERWLTDINEIFIDYESEKIKIEDDLLIININKLYYYWIWENELYEATRKSWRLDLNRAKNIKYALSVYKWIVREVYEIEKWYFSEINNLFNRYQFDWFIANNEIRNKYLHKDVSDYFKKWSQNPIKYLDLVEYLEDIALVNERLKKNDKEFISFEDMAKIQNIDLTKI